MLNYQRVFQFLYPMNCQIAPHESWCLNRAEVRMFVLPRACGGQIPAVGTRVTYIVVEEGRRRDPRDLKD